MTPDKQAELREILDDFQQYVAHSDDGAYLTANYGYKTLHDVKAETLAAITALLGQAGGTGMASPDSTPGSDVSNPLYNKEGFVNGEIAQLISDNTEELFDSPKAAPTVGVDKPDDYNDELNMAIKQLFLDGIAWGRKNPYGTPIPLPAEVPGIVEVRSLTHPAPPLDTTLKKSLKVGDNSPLDSNGELDTRDLETKLRQDLGLLEWQIRDLLPVVETELQRVRQEAEQQNILLKADIAYAIGKFEGLGHPSEYLRRRYPEFKKGIDLATYAQQRGH